MSHSKSVCLTVKLSDAIRWSFMFRKSIVYIYILFIYIFMYIYMFVLDFVMIHLLSPLLTAHPSHLLHT